MLIRTTKTARSMAKWMGGVSVAALIGLSSAQAAMNPDLFEGLNARNIGPAVTSGRVAAVDVVLNNTNIIYVGTASGGVWKSTDGGMTMEPIFDGEAVASIGALAIDQSNPDVIWVGTGEGNVRNSTSIGDGIYKSIDGGKTWQLMGLRGTERINRITIDPKNPNTVYVAAMGTLWGPNSDRGVYKTTDGGATWSKILYVDQDTGATDIKIDPSNPNKLYAAMWEFRRWPYFFKSGGDGSALYTSNDGGRNWKKLDAQDGIPAGELGRAVFAVSQSQPKTVYALVEAETSALIRSDDGGDSWYTVNTENGIADRPFYYSELQVNPTNPNHVFNVATFVRESIDGGRTFNQVEAINCCAYANDVHIDNHTFWINPNNPLHMIDGNDGGVAITQDGGDTWRFVNNMPVSQFYHVNVDNDTPYNVYGGLQDNGSWRGPSEVWEAGQIQSHHWREVSFGDGFDTSPYPLDSTQGYSMFQGGSLVRWRLGETLEFIQPVSDDPEVELRFNWNAGFAQDPHDVDTIYYGSQFVHKSTDRGDTWTTISPDLTTNNPEYQTFKESGGVTYDVTAAENFTSIVAIAPSPLDPNVVWVGTDDGKVHVTRDGGTSWNEIQSGARRAPTGAWVPMIEASPHDAGVAFVVFDDHRRSNMNTYVYKVEDYGRRWRNLGDDALSGYALSIQQDHIDPNLLFLGTEFGLFVSTNAGEDWMKWTAGVPTVSVMDMAIQARENDLVLGTHGRSIIIIDDYSALRGLNEASFNQRFNLLSVVDGIRYNQGSPQGARFPGSNHYRGENAQQGVMITFMASGDDLTHPDAETERARVIAARAAAANLPEGETPPAPPGQLTIEVSNAEGKVIRTLKRDVHQGINRVYWGMDVDGNEPLQGPPANGELPGGATVVPGEYSLKLTFDGQEETATVMVMPDPRLDVSQEDYQAAFDASKHLQSISQASNDAIRLIMSTRDSVATVKTLLNAEIADQADTASTNDEAAEGDDASEDESPAQALLTRAGELEEKLNELEELFRNRPGTTTGIVDSSTKITTYIGNAFFHIGTSLGRPSPNGLKAVAFAESQLNAGLDAINAFMDGDMATFRSDFAALNIQPLRSPERLSISSGD